MASVYEHALRYAFLFESAWQIQSARQSYASTKEDPKEAQKWLSVLSYYRRLLADVVSDDATDNYWSAGTPIPAKDPFPEQTEAVTSVLGANMLKHAKETAIALAGQKESFSFSERFIEKYMMKGDQKKVTLSSYVLRTNGDLTGLFKELFDCVNRDISLLRALQADAGSAAGFKERLDSYEKAAEKLAQLDESLFMRIFFFEMATHAAKKHRFAKTFSELETFFNKVGVVKGSRATLENTNWKELDAANEFQRSLMTLISAIKAVQNGRTDVAEHFVNKYVERAAIVALSSLHLLFSKAKDAEQERLAALVEDATIRLAGRVFTKTSLSVKLLEASAVTNYKTTRTKIASGPRPGVPDLSLLKIDDPVESDVLRFVQNRFQQKEVPKDLWEEHTDYLAELLRITVKDFEYDAPVPVDHWGQLNYLGRWVLTHKETGTPGDYKTVTDLIARAINDNKEDTVKKLLESGIDTENSSSIAKKGTLFDFLAVTSTGFLKDTTRLANLNRDISDKDSLVTRNDEHLGVAFALLVKLAFITKFSGIGATKNSVGLNPSLTLDSLGRVNSNAFAKVPTDRRVPDSADQEAELDIAQLLTNGDTGFSW